MRWSNRGMSPNVEDRRGARGTQLAGVGVGGTVILLILSLVFGRDFIGEAGDSPTATGSAAGQVEQTEAEHQLALFVSFVLDDAQAEWASMVEGYRDAKLVLFRDFTETACGVGEAAVGPFYCPVDEKVYIDLGFFDQLERRFGAPGDFAQAYVIAHEIGHHVQHLRGTDILVHRARASGDPRANALSVSLELQADCFAGVWGHRAARRGNLDPGDMEEGLRAAAAVGDDRVVQRSTGRSASSDSFTHGSAQQRAAAFGLGLQSGDPRTCDSMFP